MILKDPNLILSGHQQISALKIIKISHFMKLKLIRKRNM